MAHVVAKDSGILIPQSGVDLTKWCVVACDQYTSQREYWAQAEALVGEAPSTLRLIYPEAFLNESEADKSARIGRIQKAMGDYLARGLLQPVASPVLVERATHGNANVRRGLVIAVDLDAYEFGRTSQSLIRPTEETVVDRLPPRIRIRQGAELEVPHIMLLVNDADRKVIEPIAAAKASLEKVYSADLMLGGGHIDGYAVAGAALDNLRRALDEIVSPAWQKKHYGEGKAPLLFAVGDGNHSLATAKAIWEEKKKKGAHPSDPARWALVEIVNVHDEAIVFEPIHRVLEHLGGRSVVEGLKAKLGADRVSFERLASPEAVLAAVRKHGNAAPHKFGYITKSQCGVITVTNPTATLAVGTLQPALDQFVKENHGVAIDYVHGDDVVVELGAHEDSCGILLPAMAKPELFATVMRMGIVPRKTFSMGEASEKRFYMEARKIVA
eukprot:m51a1_g1752 hypothetical protein (442) ;mRNA; r:224605-226319